METTNLIIDDLRRPTGEQWADRDVTVLVTSAEAIAWFDAHPDAVLENLFLDHDLGIVNGAEDDVRAVVSYLEERAYFGNAVPIDTVYVHTSNGPGKAWINAALTRYYTVRLVTDDQVGLTYEGAPIPGDA